MTNPSKIRIYGVRINGDGEITETWEREGYPLQVRGVHTGHIGRVEGDGAFAESERGQFQAIDIARMLIAHQAKEANG